MEYSIKRLYFIQRLHAITITKTRIPNLKESSTIRGCRYQPRSSLSMSAVNCNQFIDYIHVFVKQNEKLEDMSLKYK